MTVSVLGAGAFGTALAIALAGSGQRLTLWARNKATAQDLQTGRVNDRYLPGAPLQTEISVTHDLKEAVARDTLLICIPTQKLTPFLHENRALFGGKNLVACCKGIDLATGLGPTGLIETNVPNATPAILTGPSFAADIARGLPTALTLACSDPAKGKYLQDILNRDALRVYRSTDSRGAELGGALKNVIAISAGAAIGAGFGDSARAALISRGFAEMRRYAEEQGASGDTLMGLSGLGDLILTCGSELSRNFRFGLTLGRGEPFEEDTTIEGMHTARAIARHAAKSDLDMPICGAVADVVDGKTDVSGAVQKLLSRPVKEE